MVLLFHDLGYGCTGTVIAPRVVLTAKHCVMNINTGADLSAWGFHVYVGPSAWRVVDEYGVVEIRHTLGRSLSNSDFALLILDRDFAHGVKRWAFAPWPGLEHNSTITAIGYGQTEFDNPRSSGTKYRRDGRVAGFGPNRRWGLGDAEFMSQGENTCQGDSGGPLLFEDVVVGIVSRGEEGCTGYGWVTRVSSFADMVREALEDTGACVPTRFEVCNGLDDDCWNGPDDGLGPDCGCAAGGVPAPEVCDRIDNDCNEQIDDLEGCGCAGGAEPAAEVCDGIDNDCNGQIDEVCARLGEPCEVDTDCASGMCGDLDGARVCTMHCRAGVDECPDNGWCDAEACGEGLCRAGRGSRSHGASCSGNGDCASGFCAPSAGGGQVCTRPCEPLRMDCFAIESCQTLGDGCAACLLPLGDPQGLAFGEPCTVNEQCLSGICFIDGDPETCGDGCTYRYCAQPCGEGGWCPEWAHCREGMCVRGPASLPGETCVRDEDCLDGWCVLYDGVARCVSSCDGAGACGEGFFCVDGSFCWPEGTLPGDECAAQGDLCEAGECVNIAGELVCVNACSNAAECPSGMSCVPSEDGLGGWCAPSSIPVDLTPNEGSSCACRAGARPTASGALWPVLLLLAAFWLRRTHR